jgi:hypothetical protein
MTTTSTNGDTDTDTETAAGSASDGEGASRRKAVEQMHDDSQMYRDTQLGEPVVLRKKDGWGLVGKRDYLDRTWTVQRPRCYVADHGCEVETISQATKVARMESGRYENVADGEVDEILDEAAEENLEWMKAEMPHIPYADGGGIKVYVDGEYLESKTTESENAIEVGGDPFEPETVVRIEYEKDGLRSIGVERNGDTVPVERVDTEDGVARYMPTPEDREFVVELRHDTGENVEDCQ